MRKVYIAGLFISLLITSFSTSGDVQSIQDRVAVEATFIRLEFYETSGDYLAVYKRCPTCNPERMRFESSATVLLNNSPSTAQRVYEQRFNLTKYIDFAYSRDNKRIIWFNAILRGGQK